MTLYWRTCADGCTSFRARVRRPCPILLSSLSTTTPPDSQRTLFPSYTQALHPCRKTSQCPAFHLLPLPLGSQPPHPPSWSTAPGLTDWRPCSYPTSAICLPWAPRPSACHQVRWPLNSTPGSRIPPWCHHPRVPGPITCRHSPRHRFQLPVPFAGYHRPLFPCAPNSIACHSHLAATTGSNSQQLRRTSHSHSHDHRFRACRHPPSPPNRPPSPNRPPPRLHCLGGFLCQQALRSPCGVPSIWCGTRPATARAPVLCCRRAASKTQTGHAAVGGCRHTSGFFARRAMLRSRPPTRRRTACSAGTLGGLGW